MRFQSSPGRILFLILLLRLTAFAQEPETVVATVNGTEIRLKQVDETVLSAIYPLQQQLYAIRKVALDNLILFCRYSRGRASPFVQRTGESELRDLSQTGAYNAAAHLFLEEQSNRGPRADSRLSFELTGFRSWNVRDIVGRSYAELVTLPTGEIVSFDAWQPCVG